MSKSQRLGFPMLAAGQAQKELTHNEALLLLDALVQGCSPSEPANDPPQSPEPASHTSVAKTRPARGQDTREALLAIPMAVGVSSVLSTACIFTTGQADADGALRQDRGRSGSSRPAKCRLME